MVNSVKDNSLVLNARLFKPSLKFTIGLISAMWGRGIVNKLLGNSK